jgi:hypothetical protein
MKSLLQLSLQFLVRDLSITEVLAILVNAIGQENSTALNFLLENMPDENKDDFLQKVATEIILPESIKDYNDQIYSQSFLLHSSTKNDLNSSYGEYEKLYKPLYSTFKNLIGKNISIKIDDDSYPMEVVLSFTSWGRKILETVIWSRRSFYPLFLKKIDQGRFKGVSVALNYLLNDDRGIYCLHLLDLGEEELNAVVQEGSYSGASIAYSFANNPIGWKLLLLNENRLAQLINENSLNAVIQSGPNAGQSVAYWLAVVPECRALLSLNENRLAQLINEDSLNAVIPSGPAAGQSVAYWLAATHEGCALLSLNENRLAQLINENTLNALIQSGLGAGTSVAYRLATTAQGRALLSLNENRLAQLINENTLNAVIPSGPDTGASVAYLLAATHEGRALLSLNENRLATLINENSLNSVIQSGSHAGKFVACWLAATPEGQVLLSLDNNRLAQLINKKRTHSATQENSSSSQLGMFNPMTGTKRILSSVTEEKEEKEDNVTKRPRRI